MTKTNLNQFLLGAIAKLTSSSKAYAHCDIPCGIYDPHHAQLAALTVVRMADLIAETKTAHADHDHTHDLARAVMVKEEHAELCKKEIRVIWGDYFKPEMLEKYPELHALVHSIMQAGSKAKQNESREHGVKLLELVNLFAEIFWETKGKTTKKAPAPYKPELEVVYPVLF